MDGAAGTDADNVSVWTDKTFANPSQRNKCGILCPPEGCRAIPQSPIKSNLNPLASLLDTAESHKQRVWQQIMSTLYPTRAMAKH